MLVPYLNNSSEEAIFGNNRIKEQYDKSNFKMKKLCSKIL